MKQIIIAILVCLYAINLYAQELNCRADGSLSGFIEHGLYQYQNHVSISNGQLTVGAKVIINAGKSILITSNNTFLADSKFIEDNGHSVFFAYIKECENYISEVLAPCNDITPDLINEEFGGKKIPGPDQSGVEYSDLAYYPAENMLFLPLDDAITNIPGNNSFTTGADRHAIRAYDLDDATEYAITLTNMPDDFLLHHDDDDVFPDADFEGITYLYENYFALIDERTRAIYFLEYSHFNKELNHVGNTESQEVLNQTIQYYATPKLGIEGISYNPYKNTLFLLSEGSGSYDVVIFEMEIVGDLSDPELVQINRFNLTQKLKDFGQQNQFTDASGIYHLSKVFPEGNENADRFLVLSQESKKILEMDIQGKIYGSFMDVSDKFQPEGLAYAPIDGTNKIIVSSEGQKEDADDNELHITAKISKYTNGCVDGGSPKIIDRLANNTSISVSPNPTVGQSVITYELVDNAKVSVFITDVLGKQIATLVNAEKQTAGLNEVMFDAVDLPTGIYFCTVNANDKVSTQKLIKAKQ